MTNPLDPSEYSPEEFARHVADRQRMMRESRLLVYEAHSRSGMLARFLQRMADAVDPTGQARRGMPRR